MASIKSYLSRLGLSFPVPSDEVFKVDMSQGDFRKLVLAGLSAIAAGTASGSSGTVAVTPTIQAMGASASVNIPAGAKGWTFTVLTGTGTIGGATVPAGFSDSDNKPLAVALTVTTAAASSAYVRWNS